MAVDQEGRVRPFSCGTQSMDWEAANCDKCGHAMDCEIDTALTIACCSDGTVSAEIARRMGYTRFGADAGHYNWPCLEHDPPFVNIEQWAEKG